MVRRKAPRRTPCVRSMKTKQKAKMQHATLRIGKTALKVKVSCKGKVSMPRATRKKYTAAKKKFACACRKRAKIDEMRQRKSKGTHRKNPRSAGNKSTFWHF